MSSVEGMLVHSSASLAHFHNACASLRLTARLKTIRFSADVITNTRVEQANRSRGKSCMTRTAANGERVRLEKDPSYSLLGDHGGDCYHYYRYRCRYPNEGSCGGRISTVEGRPERCRY